MCLDGDLPSKKLLIGHLTMSHHVMEFEFYIPTYHYIIYLYYAEIIFSFKKVFDMACVPI